jgi:hypothetical protein
MGRGLNWRLEDLTGRRFGRLVVVRRAPNRNRQVYWECRCDCGETSVVRSMNLVSGSTQSCGCYSRDQKRATVLARNAGGHGQAPRRNRTPAYTVWANMLQRCRNPRNTAWDDYGGRGIKVCERWLQFDQFYADMGDPPLGKQLDRIDNDGNYEPTNCRWADRSTQTKNQRKRSETPRDSRGQMITFNGETHNVHEWARQLGFARNTISERLRRGMSVEEALSTPLDRRQSRRRKP